MFARLSRRLAAVLLLYPSLAHAQLAVSDATVTGPIANSDGPGLGGARTGRPSLADGLGDLGAHGYVEEEYFISGMALDFGPTQLPPAPYTTRILVRRPAAPAAFNGTVLLEWFNETSTFNLDVDWAYQRAEILRSGYAYVGVSAQFMGVEGSPTALKSWDPVRYAMLAHPGDPGGLIPIPSQDYSLDIFSQAAKAVRSPAQLAPLGPLQVQRVIATGESQSATKLNSYLELVLPVMERVIDGFMIGGDPSSPPIPPGVDVPVMRVASEWEAVRNDTGEPDGPGYRLQETAGAIHASKFQADYHGSVADRDFQVPPGQHFLLVPRDEEGCLLNRYPKQYGLRAALDAFERWVRDGSAPPSAPRITLVDGVIQRDEHGNALGGIRGPAVDVPIASYNNGPVCGDPALGTYGRTDLFDEPTLRALYPTHADYYCRVLASTQLAVAQGHILRPDALELLEQADGEVRWPEDPGLQDCDLDGVDAAIDNCPLVANPSQDDHGGINTTTPDGIGDACQCGDVSGNGIVNGQDGNAIRRRGLELPDNPTFIVSGNCDVTGNGSCNGQDGNAVRAVALGIPNPLFGQNCQNADPVAPPCSNCGP